MTHVLTSFRKKNALTLEALGARIGATKGMISKWEAGKALPRAKFIQRLTAISEGEVTADLLLSAFADVQDASSDATATKVPEAAE